VMNVILRLAWMQSVLGIKEAPFLHRTALTALVASLEIIRRGIWNFFRYYFNILINFFRNSSDRTLWSITCVLACVYFICFLTNWIFYSKSIVLLKCLKICYLSSILSSSVITVSCNILSDTVRYIMLHWFLEIIIATIIKY